MASLQDWLTATTVSVQQSDFINFLLAKSSQFFSLLTVADYQAILASIGTSFALIAAAEMGDKSQLVCMALASKHRPVPVVLGALSAFALLNGLAVVFGKAIANWFPEYMIALAVAFLFAVFGFQALRTTIEQDDGEIRKKSGHSIFFTTFFLITFAEFGDKTQLAVVALSSTGNPAGVWLGSTLALGVTSTIGALSGRKLMQKIPLELLHKMGGILFLLLSGLALSKSYQSYFFS